MTFSKSFYLYVDYITLEWVFHHIWRIIPDQFSPISAILILFVSTGTKDLRFLCFCEAVDILLSVKFLTILHGPIYFTCEYRCKMA